MKAIIGSEALAGGILTRGRLRSRYQRVHTDVYLPRDGERTVSDYAEAAWLWSGRSGIVTGVAAAALHGVRWVEPDVPVELITGRRSSDPRVVTRNERHHADEVQTLPSELLLASPSRTALDLAKHLPRNDAVRHLDALAAVTGVSRVEIAILAQRYRRAPRIRESRYALCLMDGDAASQRETLLRLAMIDAGFPRPSTQIEVSGGTSTVIVPLGWEQKRVGLSFAEPDRHRDHPWHQFSRINFLQLQGWINLYVSESEPVRTTVYRVREAFRVQRIRGL